MEQFDVAIIGGGAAGLNIAQLLGKFNLKVLLLESKKDILNVSFHTLGSFINLEKFGLTRNVVASDVTECILHSKHINVKKYGKTYILNKSRLHKELFEKALTNKVDIRTPVHISSFSFSNNGNLVSVKDEQGNEYFAKIFIDCSGAAGVISKEIGLQDKNLKVARGLEYNVEYFGPQYQSHLIFGKDYIGGYGWAFPLGGNRAIFGYGTANTDRYEDLKEKMDEVLNSSSLLRKLIKKDNEEIHGGTIPITDVKRKLVSNNVVCIGDSVSQVNPLVGEGYRFVLEAGFIAAPHIYNALKENNLELLRRYEREWNSKFYSKYRIDRRLQKLAAFASKSDIFCDILNLILSTRSDAEFVNILSGFTLALTS